MDREIVKISEGIYCIENFISEDSCKFLINNLKNRIVESPRDFIYGYIHSEYPKYLSIIGEYSDIAFENISIDLINNIFLSMGYLIKDIFKKDHILKQTYYSVMYKGAENELHIDNYYRDEYGKMQPRKNSKNDKSSVLYLNENYLGGELYFPKQNLKFKPKPGTLVVFEGSTEKPHGVLKVSEGVRHNLITFFEPKI